NQAAVTILPVPERLILLEARTAAQHEYLFDPQQRARVSTLVMAPVGPVGEPRIVGETQNLKQYAIFDLYETVRGTPQGGEPVYFQYRPRSAPEGAPWSQVGPFFGTGSIGIEIS